MSREILADAFMHGLGAVEPERLVRECSLNIVPEAFVAVGKAAPAMARGALERWPGLEGLVVTTRDMVSKTPKGVEAYGAGHPLPDDTGLRAVERVEELLCSKCGTVLFLLSGGGSALLPSPIPPLELEDLRYITRRMLLGGASILEMNIVRRHLERLKGGGLLSITDADVVSLIISDVVEGGLWAVASGPTIASGPSKDDAKRILEKYMMMDDRTERALAYEKNLREGRSIVLADNRTATRACASRLEKLCHHPVYIVPGPLVDEARAAGRFFAAEVREHALVVAGGETVVHVQGNGKGGRNQEMALSALMESCMGTMLFASTDGVDGVTDAAGAFADASALDAAEKMDLDMQSFLDNNDSHTFFSRTGGLFKTGPTGTNVCDLALGILQQS